jgi:hypothetical protein
MLRTDTCVQPTARAVWFALAGSLAVALVVLAGPASRGALGASAQRGVAPLQVPGSGGRLHTATDAHISFRLPKGAWRTDRSDTAEPVRDGSYLRITSLNGRRCSVSITVGGRGQRQRPSLKTTPKSDHVQRGVSGGVHWLSAWSELPPTPPLPYASAYSRAPTWATWNWASFNLGAQVIGRRTAACRRSMLGIDLAAVARSVRVERGGVTSG